MLLMVQLSLVKFLQKLDNNFFLDPEVARIQTGGFVGLCVLFLKLLAFLVIVLDLLPHFGQFTVEEFFCVHVYLGCGCLPLMVQLSQSPIFWNTVN